MTRYPRRRALTGAYISIYRNDEYVSIDVSDLTEEEIRENFKEVSQKQMINWLVTLTTVIKKLGERCNAPFVKTREELEAES